MRDEDESEERIVGFGVRADISYWMVDIGYRITKFGGGFRMAEDKLQTH